MNIEKLYEILLSKKPSDEIKRCEEEIFNFIPELRVCKGFDQKNPWHIYDVYEHTLHVVDGVKPNLLVRLAALFHDIGKPISFNQDDQGIGHFHGHWEESQKIFEEFAKKNNIDDETIYIVSNLIFYHDLNLLKLSDDDIGVVKNIFKEDGLELLFNLKESDLYAHSKKYHSYIEVINKMKERLNYTR
ncbi:MAG: HD domain-containing protein [Bacilli bacterium]|nr:HD domain-containing protein [Bacilli bacterium]